MLRAREDTLRAAYELGREAVSRGLSLLDVAQVHHEALWSEIRLEGVEAEAVVRAAGEFFLEIVSSYEMVRRGFEETSEAALLQKSRLEMLRELSNFLADTSLASDSAEPVKEVLQLIAEQARELTGAELCVVSLNGYGWSLGASSYSAGDPDRAGELEAGHPSAVASLPASEGRLATALRSLDGKEFGSIELFDNSREDFTALDRAALVHLSQMASATIERIHLHLIELSGD